MLARVFSCAVIGLEGVVVEVEVDPANGLPIARGVLLASGQLPPGDLESALVVGELSLDGSVRHVRGVLPVAALARQLGYQRVFVPQADAPAAAPIPDLQVA